MNQSIRSALDVWHYKTQAQVWRKQLLNHTMAQLPWAALKYEQGEKERQMELREENKIQERRESDAQVLVMDLYFGILGEWAGNKSLNDMFWA